jgi:hypothetical protein
MEANVRHIILGGLLAASAVSPLAAQLPRESTKLAAVLTAFLADSGVPTRGLPWTSGNALPIRWQSTGPVQNTDPYARQRGITHMRAGVFRGTLGDSVTLPMDIVVTGTATGIAGVNIIPRTLLVETGGGAGFFMTREMMEQALRNDGLMLTPRKCDRAKEGASYGNLVDAVKAPGKMASGLWWMWQSMQQELQVSMSLIYRNAEMNQVECAEG